MEVNNGVLSCGGLRQRRRTERNLGLGFRYSLLPSRLQFSQLHSFDEEYSSLPNSVKMAILSATTLLRTISLFHLTCAYYLLTSPAKLADHNLVFILGASMDISPASGSSLSFSSPALALAALFLTILGISDLAATGLPEEVASYYWSSQAPIRLAVFFGITGFSYLGKAGAKGMLPKGANHPGVSGLVCNNVVFTWGFVEMLGWFWVSLFEWERRAEGTC